MATALGSAVPAVPAPAAEPADRSLVRPFRWNRAQFQWLAAAGVFVDHGRVELIDGEIVTLPPQLRPHALAIVLSREALRTVFGAGYYVQDQLPIALGPESQPEPDVAVIKGNPRDLPDDHPSEAALILEVADSTLRHDRQRRRSLYARHSVADYWILNLQKRVLEVHRDPRPDPTAEFGLSYSVRLVFGEAEVVEPLALPGRRVAVKDLLP
jgi:Uma2 family endonuclease